MLNTSIINTFQKSLSTFQFIEPESFSERFAQDRYWKKLEVPCNSHLDLLTSQCWENWLSNDEALPEIELPHKEWYIARDFLHRNLKQYRHKTMRFPKGSEFHPTRGHNSLEARLTKSKWTCTHDNFIGFADLVYGSNALKKAFRKRYDKWYNSKKLKITKCQFDKYLYKKFKRTENIGREIFKWKLSKITTFVYGSRWSSVYKNTEKRRPINVEPFGNILTQLSIGSDIRHQIKQIFDVDLDTLADTQRLRIKDVDQVATIDLKDASDSISWSLCCFLLPKSLISTLERARSQMTYGHDKNYHVVKKVSSMGNGFTFELMTLILTTVCRTLDSSATVFGDDIIINSTKSSRLIELLTSVGLKVNVEKSFTEGPFRESCGGNYHKDEGYIESYDFKYPESIGDCVLTWNKIVRLGRLYPSFHKLKQVLYRSIPNALRGGPCHSFETSDILDLYGNHGLNKEPVVSFPLFFVTEKWPDKKVKINPQVQERIRNYQYDVKSFNAVCGFEFKPELRTPTASVMSSYQWGKYLMYLHAGMKTADVLGGTGKWVNIQLVSSGTEIFRTRSLMS